MAMGVEEIEPRYPNIHITLQYQEEGRIFEEAVTPPVCDFCFDIGPKWDYPCEDFVLPNGFGSIDGWAVCDPCSKLIEAGDIAARAERTMKPIKQFNRGIPETRAVEDAYLIITGFLQHRTGPREPFG